MSLREARLGYKESFLALPRLYAAARKLLLERGSRVPGLGPKLVELALKRKYGARVITPKKVRNFIQANREEAKKAVVVDSVPYHLNLDLYNVCNLRCRFCPTGTEQLERERVRMTVAQAKEIVDAVKDYVITFSPFHWGEPLLNPDIFEVIEYGHRVGMFTQIHSNLSLKMKDLGRRLVESKLDTLLVSIDGLDQQVNENYRRRVNNDLVFANIRDIVAARKSLRSRTPRIEVAFLVFRHNEHEVPLLDAKRKELGVDAFLTRKAAIYEESWIPESKDFQPLQQIFTGTCSFLYADLNVEPDGGISPCCINSSKKWDVGRIEDLKDLKAFWNNPTHQAMRSYFAHFHDEGRPAPGGKELLCQSCNWVADCRAHDDFGRLSPLPPALAVESVGFDHGIETVSLPVLQG
jgi:radical SAM protein with 4Fe4S-binding SPASM domain